MKYPNVRLRRLRENPKLRALLSEHTLLLKELIQPLFIKEGLSRPIEIPSMPGQYQWTLTTLAEEAVKIESLGISAVILFGIPQEKDIAGRLAFAKKGIVQRAVAAIKKNVQSFL